MRKVIEGNVYDTNAAAIIHSWDSGHYAGDFHRVQEALYVTPNGAYFLHGEGGALTGYAVSVGDMRGAGDALVPMTEAEALTWLEEHDADASTIERLFTVEEA